MFVSIIVSLAFSVLFLLCFAFSHWIGCFWLSFLGELLFAFVVAIFAICTPGRLLFCFAFSLLSSRPRTGSATAFLFSRWIIDHKVEARSVNVMNTHTHTHCCLFPLLCVFLWRYRLISVVIFSWTGNGQEWTWCCRMDVRACVWCLVSGCSSSWYVLYLLCGFPLGSWALAWPRAGSLRSAYVWIQSINQSINIRDLACNKMYQ